MTVNVWIDVVSLKYTTRLLCLVFAGQGLAEMMESVSCVLIIRWSMMMESVVDVLVVLLVSIRESVDVAGSMLQLMEIVEDVTKFQELLWEMKVMQGVSNVLLD